MSWLPGIMHCRALCVLGMLVPICVWNCGMQWELTLHECWWFCRKRYDKAESEYVAAKLDLQHKTEIKEHLTEHLCTIIQQNELRKARKLEELMQQLEVEADEENLELEIEVERILQQQEAEAGRQASQSHSHAGTAKESPTPSAAVCKTEHASHDVISTSEQLVQPQNSGTKSLSSVDSQTQAVNVTPGSPPAHSATWLLCSDKPAGYGSYTVGLCAVCCIWASAVLIICT